MVFSPWLRKDAPQEDVAGLFRLAGDLQQLVSFTPSTGSGRKLGLALVNVPVLSTTNVFTFPGFERLGITDEDSSRALFPCRP